MPELARREDRAIWRTFRTALDEGTHTRLMAINVNPAGLGAALSKLASLIQELGNEHFRADDAWRKLPSRFELLESSHQDLVRKLKASDLDLPTAASFSGAVKHATEVLDGEVAKLSRSAQSPHACAWRCCGGFCLESVDKYLQAAEATYRKVSENLNLQLHNSKPWSKSTKGQPLGDDERYVPRDVLERKIHSALQGSAVVLLSGSPGKGKSALARQMRLQFEKETPFVQSIMLECGPNLNVAAKRTELVQTLGWHLSQQSGVNFHVFEGLEDRLRDQPLLVVLDDLWEPQLLYSLVHLSGSNAKSGAKWLVTSQNKSVCDSLNCHWVTYEMEDLSHEDARKILASHAGFEDKSIPPRLQEVADILTRQAKANPLVLAILGAQIATAGRETSEVWESVLDDHFALLGSETLVHNHDGVIHHPFLTYPRSFTVTIKRSIDLLTLARKQLLVLIGMCTGLSISKHALHFLYCIAISKGNCSLLAFTTSCNDLESRHLLAENENQLLRIHSLTKEFILEQMQDSVKAVENLLKEASFETKGNLENFDPSKTLVTRVLADLFIENFRDKARARATQSDIPSRLLKFEEIQPSSGSIANVKLNVETKRIIIESILELLVLEAGPSNEWTEELGLCAQKVFLEFVDKDCLAHESISQLLGSSRAVRPTLTFLKHVCQLENSFWEGNSIGSLPPAFLNLLRDSSCTEVQEQAASVLADLCWSHQGNSNAFASTTDMLPQLGLFLSQAYNSNLQKYAARVLAAYAYWDYYCDGSVVPKILAEAGVVDSLVDVLDKEQNEENLSVQIAVAYALSNLAAANAVLEETVSDHGDPNLRQDRTSLIFILRALEVLMKSLKLSESPVLQAHACSTLANITANIVRTDKNETLETLLNFPWLVDELVSILNEDRSSQLQVQAARALCNLATYREGSLIRQKLIHWPELVKALANSLLRSENPSLQRNAVRAFAHLAYQIEKDTAHGVINHAALVESLMELFSQTHNSSVKTANLAVSALCSLTDVGDDSLRARIASSQPFLTMLTKSILAGDRESDPNVVCLIANLAVTSEAGILDDIANTPGLVEKLANSLGETQNSSLQEHAVRALLNLAGEENNDNFDIADFPEQLQRLQPAFLRSERPALRKAASEVTALISVGFGE